MSKNITFYEGFVSHVPTECLVEDYQMLQRVLNRLNNSLYKADPIIADCVEDIGTALECIAESMDRYTELPSLCAPDFKPSPSSIVALGYQNGIVGCEDGSDIPCIAGKPVSKAMTGGVLQCENCEFLKNGKCDPDKGRLLLEDDIVYDGSIDSVEEFMDANHWTH